MCRTLLLVSLVLVGLWGQETRRNGDMRKAVYDSDGDGVIDAAAGGTGSTNGNASLSTAQSNYLLNRTNHVGLQASSTIYDFYTASSNNVFLVVTNVGLGKITAGNIVLSNNVIRPLTGDLKLTGSQNLLITAFGWTSNTSTAIYHDGETWLGADLRGDSVTIHGDTFTVGSGLAPANVSFNIQLGGGDIQNCANGHIDNITATGSSSMENLTIPSTLTVNGLATFNDHVIFNNFWYSGGDAHLDGTVYISNGVNILNGNGITFEGVGGGFTFNGAGGANVTGFVNFNDFITVGGFTNIGLTALTSDVFINGGRAFDNYVTNVFTRNYTNAGNAFSNISTLTFTNADPNAVYEVSWYFERQASSVLGDVETYISNAGNATLWANPDFITANVGAWDDSSGSFQISTNFSIVSLNYRNALAEGNAVIRRPRLTAKRIK